MFVFINYKQNRSPDHELADQIEDFLKGEGHYVFRDESKLKGGDDWPQKILENLRKSHVVLSIVSNASMQSKWVINEIDEAIRLQKPLIPVVLEELDKDLEFKKYRPRFVDIQYIRYDGKVNNVISKIREAVRELQPEFRSRQLTEHNRIISQVLAKHQIDDPTVIICQLLEFLHTFHVVPAAASELDPNRRMPALVGFGTFRSISEVLGDALRELADICNHNYENGKQKRSEHVWWWEERLRPSACLADLFEIALSQWEDQVKEVKEHMTARQRRVPKSSAE